jgi:hypothetical protein
MVFFFLSSAISSSVFRQPRLMKYHMEIDSDVYKSKELHASAEKLTRGLTRIFQKGCETANYAAGYSGPLQEAYDLIDKVNKKIELRNNSNGFERMPYIEIGGVYPIFEKCLEKAKVEKQQRNDKFRAITMEEFLWQMPMPQFIPSSLKQLG